MATKVVQFQAEALAQEDLKNIYKCLLLTPGISTGSENSFTIQNIVQETPSEFWGIPFTLMGDPGIGKSSLVKTICREIDLPCFSIIAALKDPTYFSGIPVIKEVEILIGDQVKKVSLQDAAIPAEFFEIAMLGNAAINFDELSCAPAATQAALLTVLLERKVGNFQLPAGIRLFATANPSSQAANGSTISLPLANRMAWFKTSAPSIEEWSSFMLSSQKTSQKKDQSKEPLFKTIQKQVEERWPDALSQAKGMVISFINVKREAGLFCLPVEGAENEVDSLTYPTPRSWTMATHALAGAIAHGLSKTCMHFILSGIVGSGLALEFMSFIKNMDLPTASDILDEVVPFAFNKDRLDIGYAIVSSCQALLYSMNTRRKSLSAGTEAEKKYTALFEKRLINLLKIAERLHSVNTDLTLKILLTGTSFNLNKNPEIFKIISKLAPFYSKLASTDR